MKYIYKPFKWQVKIYKEHRFDCGCNRCFNAFVKHKKEKTRDYFEYIKSKDWQDRKDKYYKKHKRICRACGTNKNIDLHHIIYGNFGKEKDTSLIPFCRDCHKEFHYVYKTQGNLEYQTKQYIQHKQRQIQHIIDKLQS